MLCCLYGKKETSRGNAESNKNVSTDRSDSNLRCTFEKVVTKDLLAIEVEDGANRTTLSSNPLWKAAQQETALFQPRNRTWELRNCLQRSSTWVTWESLDLTLRIYVHCKTGMESFSTHPCHPYPSLQCPPFEFWTKPPLPDRSGQHLVLPQHGTGKVPPSPWSGPQAEETMAPRKIIFFLTIPTAKTRC